MRPPSTWCTYCLVVVLILSGHGLAAAAPSTGPRVLPGELTAEEVLNGTYDFPAPAPAAVTYDATGLERSRLGRTPAPGVHPRILLSPDELPELRQRLNDTSAGRAMLATLRERVAGSIGHTGAWEHDVFVRLVAQDGAGALAIMDRGLAPSFPAGHYQPNVLYALVMESFDALITNDPAKGRRIAAAIAGYAAMIEPLVEKNLNQPLADDVWRIKMAGPATGRWSDNQGLRELLGYHNLGYAYDFAFPFMTEAERTQVRRLIARVTAGRIWLGASLPHHWRNWNWTQVGLSQPLLALAIEGEEGYDPRVYRMGVAIARDYLTYGISPSGASTEAVGYTQFGFVWAVPFYVAAARRGEDLLTHGHHRAMIDWYLHSMEPYAAVWHNPGEAGDSEQRQRNLSPLWTSHGDGGDEGPSLWTMAMWKYFYPQDAKIDLLWRITANSGRGQPFSGQYHIVEPLLWSSEAPPVSDPRAVEKLAQPLAWFDPVRSSLIAHSSWQTDASVLQFECRTDTVTPSHEHADRGNFTFSALGRPWAKESFRSIESRHHSLVLVDGLGQGFWSGPGVWLGQQDKGWALLAACDSKYAYDWWWPKTILTDPPESVRFQFSRWATMGEDAARWRESNHGQPMERDPSPSVVAHFQGFEKHGPRMWDEDAWPMRLPHNPVQRSFRSVAFVRGPRPYVLVVDDIQKDERERLYEWLMMTGPNTEVAAIKDNDIILCDATIPHDANGFARPAQGERLLLVRTVEAAQPKTNREYQARPSARLETFEKKDTTTHDGRSFGIDKRLVIASRAVAPDFKILLYPHRQGEPLPVTTWSEDHTKLTVTTAGRQDEFTFTRGTDGRTRISLSRAGEAAVTLP
jgi:hypothetical protein